jgi:hypothetical protein
MKKFTGFYEDEESLKMMESINRASDLERERKMKLAKVQNEKAKVQAKKEARSNKLFMIGVFVSMVFIATGLLYLANKSYESNYNYCVANGHSAEVCEAHLSK